MTVAGQAAYQLVLAPRSSRSLIGQVRIAIDSRRRVPLRVQVFGRGAASPAAQVGFTAVSFGLRRPPTTRSPRPPGPGSSSSTTGRPAGAPPGRTVSGLTSDVRVIGTGWLAVASLPESALAEPVRRRAATCSRSATQQRRGAGIGRAPGARRGAGRSLLGELLNSAPRVSGSWGSGRLIRTRLLSILVTSTGRVLIGAVTPGVLYHAVSQPGRPLTSLSQHASSRARPK